MSTAESGELIIALMNAVDGREEEFSTWYTQEHLPEVVRLPGIKSAQRYVLPEPLSGKLPFAFATVYEVEGSSAAAMHTIHTAHYETHSDSLDVGTMIMSPFTPLGSPVAAD